MSDEPFGRQPQPVTVIIQGDPRDVEYWLRHFERAAEFKGDSVQVRGDTAHTTGLIMVARSFTIYPRAVND